MTFQLSGTINNPRVKFGCFDNRNNRHNSAQMEGFGSAAEQSVGKVNNQWEFYPDQNTPSHFIN